MKTFLNIFLAFTILACLQIPMTSATEFPDVKEDAWFYPIVQEVTNSGLMEGYPDGRFGAWDAINRAELAKVMLTLKSQLKAHWFKDNIVEIILVLTTVLGWMSVLNSMKKTLLETSSRNQSTHQIRKPSESGRQQRSLRQTSQNTTKKPSEGSPKAQQSKQMPSTNAIEKNLQSNWWSE